MVTCTGFEPVNVALRGQCVNRFTNKPVPILLYINKIFFKGFYPVFLLEHKKE